MKSQSCMGCWDHKLLSLCVANNFGLYFILLSCIIFLCLQILIYKYGDWPYYAAHPVEKAKRGHMRRHFHCSEPWWIQYVSTCRQVVQVSPPPTEPESLQWIDKSSRNFIIWHKKHMRPPRAPANVLLFSQRRTDSLRDIALDRTTLMVLEGSILTSVTSQLQVSQKPNSSLAWGCHCLPARKNEQRGALM